VDKRVLKIPKHGGPDGQGLPEAAFRELIKMIYDTTVTDSELAEAIKLCFSASTQTEWNEHHRPILAKHTVEPPQQ